jgi:hypothetical protein
MPPPPKSTRKKGDRGPERVTEEGLPVWWRPYFAAIAENGGFKVAAARTVGIDRSTPTQYLKDHPQFLPLFEAMMQEAMDAASDDLMAEAKRRGGPGFEEPVIHQGRLMYRICAGAGTPGELEGEEKRAECPYCHVPLFLVAGAFPEHPALDGNGQPIPLTVRKHSDTLLMFTLNARGRGTRNTNYTLDLSKLSTEQLQRLAAGEDPLDVLAVGKKG